MPETRVICLLLVAASHVAVVLDGPLCGGVLTTAQVGIGI